MASTDSHQFNPCFLITVSPGEQESGCYGAVSVEFKKILGKQGAAGSTLIQYGTVLRLAYGHLELETTL